MNKDDSARTIIESLINVLENCNISTGICCCGSAVDQHGFGDGHSPVDEGEYYGYLALVEARNFLKRTQNENANDGPAVLEFVEEF